MKRFLKKFIALLLVIGMGATSYSSIPLSYSKDRKTEGPFSQQAFAERSAEAFPSGSRSASLWRDQGTAAKDAKAIHEILNSTRKQSKSAVTKAHELARLEAILNPEFMNQLHIPTKIKHPSRFFHWLEHRIIDIAGSNDGLWLNEWLKQPEALAELTIDWTDQKIEDLKKLMDAKERLAFVLERYNITYRSA